MGNWVRREIIPVAGVGFTAPTVAAGVAAAAVLVCVGAVEEVAVPEDEAACCCWFCFLFLRRAQRALKPFFTCWAASGAIDHKKVAC